MVLYVNACARQQSRTNALALHLLDRLGDYEEVNLTRVNPQPLSEEMLIRRTALIEKRDYSDGYFDYAKQFAAADSIVISAPYWDLSFPSVLKCYIENIYITGLVSRYGENGIPVGLCKARNLYYVTTAGGPYNPAFSFDYIKSLAKDCFGIKNVHLIKAEMLDVDGFDADEIMKKAMNEIDSMDINGGENNA